MKFDPDVEGLAGRFGHKVVDGLNFIVRIYSDERNLVAIQEPDVGNFLMQGNEDITENTH